MDSFITLANRPWFFPVLGGLVAAYLLTLSIVLAVWTARDAKRRSTRATFRIGAPVFVLAFGLVGFVIYVALRPRRTLEEREEELRERSLLARAVARATCPACKAEVESDFASCPFCKVDFAPVCVACGGVIKTTWKRCGFCGVEVSSEIRAKKYTLPIPLDVEVFAIAAPKSWPVSAKSASGKKPQQIDGKVAKAEKPALPQEKSKKPAASNIAITFKQLFAIKR